MKRTTIPIVYESTRESNEICLKMNKNTTNQEACRLRRISHAQINLPIIVNQNHLTCK